VVAGLGWGLVGFWWCRSAVQPAIEGGLAFAAVSSGEESFDADVFVELRPFDRVAVTEEFPVVAFVGGCMVQSGIPVEGDRELATIGEVDGEGGVGEFDVGGGGFSGQG
jgi:hypothetical protein